MGGWIQHQCHDVAIDIDICILGDGKERAGIVVLVPVARGAEIQNIIGRHGDTAGVRGPVEPVGAVFQAGRVIEGDSGCLARLDGEQIRFGNDDGASGNIIVSVSRQRFVFDAEQILLAVVLNLCRQLGIAQGRATRERGHENGLMAGVHCDAEVIQRGPRIIVVIVKLDAHRRSLRNTLLKGKRIDQKTGLLGKREGLGAEEAAGGEVAELGDCLGKGGGIFVGRIAGKCTRGRIVNAV